MIYDFIELWATQQTEKIDRQVQKDKYVRITIRELIVYLVFLTILSIGKRKFFILFLYFRFLFLVVYGMVSNSMYILTQAMQNTFINPMLTDESNNKTGPSFEGLDRMEDFWEVKKKKEKFIFS
jgi:hypothetical protein